MVLTLLCKNKEDLGGDAMLNYYIKRTNISADSDVTIIGKRFMCGKEALPYDSKKSAESALKRQKAQDEELCPDCIIAYEIISESEVF